MASDISYINYLCEQVRDTGIVTSRKMFGDYMVYVNFKPVILVCNNTSYVKKLDCISSLMDGAGTGIPYDGAKEHYILDIDDRVLTCKIITELEKVTPVPIKKKKKTA